MARRLLGGIALLLALGAPAWAQAPSSAVMTTPPQPIWKDLGVEQRKILAPLSRDWDRMENYRRKKWLGIAERYPKMRPEAQQRVDKRMRDWAAMSPEQRAKIRRDYKAFSQLPPERKAAIQKKWQDYSKLPEEEKKRLKRGEKRSAVKPESDVEGKPSTTALPVETTPETGSASQIQR